MHATNTVTNMTSPLGYDTPVVQGWLAQHVPHLEPPLHWTRLEGGHSNLTCLIEDSAGQKVVIRRPPLGVLLPKAHDMGREWALISALGPTAVPVASALAFCEDITVTGAHFYVMGHVPGHALNSAQDTALYVPLAERRALAHSYIDILAALHALDPDTVGLGDLGKKDGYILRQLSTWYRSWNASIEGAKFDDPRAHSLQAFFAAHVPLQGPARIVHGDYTLRNCLTGANCRIAAVLDWEICALGDPMADLGYAMNHWAEAGDEPSVRGSLATDIEGFPTRADMVARYAAKTGRDVSKLDYYVGFNHWKSAAILHGVYARYLQGKKSSEGLDLAALRQGITMHLDHAQTAVSRLDC